MKTVLMGFNYRLLSLAASLMMIQPLKAEQISPMEPVTVVIDHYHQGASNTQPSVEQQGSTQPSTSPVQQGSQGQQEMSAVPAVEKSRKLSRTFAARADKPYSLQTRYGRVQINTWNRAEIRTDVDIITRADSDEKAQELMNMIQVRMQENDPTTGGIAVQSKFGAMPNGCASRQRLYEVNYTVWLPKNTSLRVYNTFGDVSINNDLTGTTELAVEYGSLRTSRLDGPQNLLRIGNGQSTIAFAGKASIDASYSKLRLDAGEVVDLRNNYSDIDIGTVRDLTVHSKYGDVALGTVRNLRGSSGFSKFSIDQLNDQLDMKVQYCPVFEVRNTGKNFRQINLDGGYSTFLLNFSEGAGFDFDVNTLHGKLLVDKDLVRVRSEESSSTASDTQGKFGGASAKNSGNVNIKVRYGNVSFNK
ncbi:hypothetical protein [Hymenobacter sp. HDW8]|uniref:hypothetical protein n=1 Tax=Hymenobacter sp. HDW8 TaxID=2714932 RepID=UPI001409E266|nr:hypothetical protein [Hymenobacter sp. HDW8]QIL75918.1 hypothetical protein G7064_08655 [Hymenobacter sp. HDW8]